MLSTKLTSYGYSALFDDVFAFFHSTNTYGCRITAEIIITHFAECWHQNLSNIYGAKMLLVHFVTDWRHLHNVNYMTETIHLSTRNQSASILIITSSFKSFFFFYWKLPNITLVQCLPCEDLLLFFVLYATVNWAFWGFWLLVRKTSFLMTSL